jgi:hypothetical protein
MLQEHSDWPHLAQVFKLGDHAIPNNVVISLLHQYGPPNVAQGQRSTGYRMERLLGTLA